MCDSQQTAYWHTCSLRKPLLHGQHEDDQNGEAPDLERGEHHEDKTDEKGLDKVMHSDLHNVRLDSDHDFPTHDGWKKFLDSPAFATSCCIFLCFILKTCQQVCQAAVLSSVPSTLTCKSVVTASSCHEGKMRACLLDPSCLTTAWSGAAAVQSMQQPVVCLLYGSLSCYALAAAHKFAVRYKVALSPVHILTRAVADSAATVPALVELRMACSGIYRRAASLHRVPKRLPVERWRVWHYDWHTRVVCPCCQPACSQGS